jgi:uncharacterized FlaG/YvyC family protein
MTPVQGVTAVERVQPPRPDDQSTQQKYAARETAATQQEDGIAIKKRVEIAERLIGANKSLVIEKDTQRQGYIYKTIDRETGEVIRVWPRQDVASALKAVSESNKSAIIEGMMVDATV